MATTRAVAILVAVTLLACGCDERGTLLGPRGLSRYEIDSSGLGDGHLLTPYQGALRLRGYGGPVTWAVTGGELPSGLGLHPSGAVSGTPTRVGQVPFEVAVSDGAHAGVTGWVAMRITAGDAPVHLGWSHDQTTRLTAAHGLMLDLWVRVRGGGEESSTYTLDPGLYLAGPDGIPEAGHGDDLRVGDLSAADLEISLGQWEVVTDDGQPPHVPEDSPPSFDGALTFRAGADTGELPVTISSEHGVQETRLMVVPPDWCPEGRDGYDGWCL